MRATSRILALALTAALQPAIAAVAPISLNFEDISSAFNEDGVVNLLNPPYTGGNAGVQFAGDSWAAASTACNGDNIVTFVTHAGGCNAFMLAGDLTTTLPAQPGTKKAFINLAAGFVTGSHLYYSALTSSSLSIKAYTGLNGGGDLVQFLDDPKDGNDGNPTAIGGCGNGATFCNWSLLNLNLGSATAKSLVISGIDSAVMLDDLYFVAPADVTQPPTGLPEPGSIALAMTALGALGWSRKRKAR